MHKLTHAVIRWLWSLSAIGLLVGCSAPRSLTPPLGELPGLGGLQYAVPLGELSRSQARTLVMVAGEVVAVVPMVDQALYQLADESGQVWVLTSAPPPPLGTELRLEVEMRYETILVQGQDIGEVYALERQRLD